MREKLSHKYQIHSKNVIWIVTLVHNCVQIDNKWGRGFDLNFLTNS